MIQRWDRPSDKNELKKRFGSGLLKVCPVCGTLNIEDVQECFVCWWHGDFDTDPLNVQLRLTELVSRCPELIGLLEEPPKPTSRFVLTLRRLWSRFRSKLDIRA